MKTKDNNCGIIFTCTGPDCKHFTKRRSIAKPCKECSSYERGECKDHLMYDYCEKFTTWEDSKIKCLFCEGYIGSIEACTNLKAQVEIINEYEKSLENK